MSNDYWHFFTFFYNRNQIKRVVNNGGAKDTLPLKTCFFFNKMKIMKRYKFFLTAVIGCTLLFAPTGLFAEENEESEKADFTQAVTGIFVANTGQGFEPYHLALEAAYTLDTETLSATGAVKAAKGDLQFTAKCIWLPLGINTEWMSLKLGAGLIYNFDAYLPYSISNNLLPGAYLHFAPGKHWCLTADISYFFKGRTLFAIADKNPLLVNSTIAFRLRNDFFINEAFGAYLEVSSYELFRYMILCAPSLTLGGTFNTGNSLSFALEATARFTDFFTVSAYYDSTEVRFLVRYEF